MGFFGIHAERVNCRGVLTQKFFDKLYGAIPDPQPDEFRGTAVQKAPSLEVGILGNNDKTILFCILPYCGVFRISKLSFAYVPATGVEVGNFLNQPRG